MRSVRFLSTRQPLWELPKPHVTQSTKKLLRKVEMRIAPQVVAAQTKQHLQQFLQGYILGQEERVKREDKQRELQAVLASRFGKEVLVEDISMASYGLDIRNAPMEFAIVDAAYPAANIPLKTMQSHVLSEIHNHKNVFRLSFTSYLLNFSLSTGASWRFYSRPDFDVMFRSTIWILK
ncbi:uncharacterized protein BT62DRAFT_583332 [Guyanagaster necrorhizus]|uniref:Uncharacterized protein n=1 Tax=Guyanagaster necrorhizus TaxID=856835 RepID=A0A9P7VH37_9AGAR|nr:uncharacterized protein BT62DRAFT_583332 [Guyanagaster necrorhizus MCA 3950]KAG7440442.1 hypothetical protein BT62DRAFT_583332 [Guyanagaster necrorhizus MCA 3950]